MLDTCIKLCPTVGDMTYKILYTCKVQMKHYYIVDMTDADINQ